MSYSTIEELYQYVKRYCLYSALAYIGNIGYRKIMNDPRIIGLYPTIINEWQLAFISKGLILNSNDYKSKILDEKELFKCANIYNNLNDKFFKASQNNDEEFQKAGQSFIIRTAYQQFPSYRGINYLISRALFLFEDIPNTINNPSFEIAKEIRSIYDLSTKEVMMVGFAIFSTIKEGCFDPEYLINSNNNDLNKFLTKDILDKLIDKLSASYEELREVFRYEKEEKGLEHFGFNALKIYPIVKTKIAGLVVPVPRFLLERITTGIYYSLMDKFKSEKSNLFLEFFGKEIFERYVGLLLGQKYQIGISIFKELEYEKGKNKCNASDWIIIQDNKAILVECKTSGISLEAKSRAELETVQNDLKLRVVRAIEQMINLVNDVNKKYKGLERLYSIKKFYYVVVTYDKIYLSSSFIIKGIIKEELAKKGITAPEYEILSVDELEILIPFLEDFNFDFLLDNKFKHKEWSELDFNEYMYDFLTKNSLDTKKENEMLKNKCDKFFEEISPRLKYIRKLS